MRLPLSLNLSILLTLPLPTVSSGLPFNFFPPAPRPAQAPLPIPISNMPSPPPSGSLLSDTLPLTRRINIFASLLREHPSLPALLASPPPSQEDNPSQDASNFTILAPLNSAMQAQPHKPWESTNDYSVMGAEAYAGEEGGKRAEENVQGFVERHVLRLGGRWGEGEKGKKVRTMAGREVWWEEREEEEGKKRVIMPDEVEVVEVASRVENGELWVIKGVLGA